MCGGLRLGGGSTLTDAGDDEEHEQRVGHGQHGLGQRAEDVLERLHAAEEPDHAQGAHDAQHVGGHGDGAERDQREGDHDHVQLVPAVGGEAEEPMREHVDQELGGEDGREEDVDALEDARLAGGGGVLGRDAGGGDANAALGGGDAGEEVLPARASGRGAVMLYFSPRVARRSSCSVENIEVHGSRPALEWCPWFESRGGARGSVLPSLKILGGFIKWPWGSRGPFRFFPSREAVMVCWRRPRPRWGPRSGRTHKLASLQGLRAMLSPSCAPLKDCAYALSEL